jgi:hypothetical protein
MVCAVSDAYRRLTLPAVPRRLTVGFILPRAERPLQSPFSQLLASVFRASDRSRSPEMEAPQGVSRSLIAATACGVHLSRRAPSSTLRSVLGVPPALDGFLHHMPCGSVSPHNHVQGFPFRGLATSQSRTGSSPASALLPFPSTRLPIRRRLRHADPRLQGFAPHDECADLRWRVSPIRTTRPSWDSLSSRFPIPNRRNAFTLLPPTALSSRSPSGMTHGVSPARNLLGLEPDRQPCTRFPA